MRRTNGTFPLELLVLPKVSQTVTMLWAVVYRVLLKVSPTVTMLWAVVYRVLLRMTATSAKVYRDVLIMSVYAAAAELSWMKM